MQGEAVKKKCPYIITVLLQATDYGTVSANIKHLGRDNKNLQPRNFICCPHTTYGHTRHT